MITMEQQQIGRITFLFQVYWQAYLQEKIQLEEDNKTALLLGLKPSSEEDLEEIVLSLSEISIALLSLVGEQ